MDGMLQVYTGNGKGKTTAAIGLAVRAAGAGMNVFIGQFVKGMKYNEIKVLNNIPEITVKQYGLDCFIEKDPTKEDIEAARAGLKEMEKIIKSGDYELVIMDEVSIAVYFNLFTNDELLEMIEKRADNVEIVLTGRYADKKLIEMADLVTEMKEIKHYYTQGIITREGIER